MTDATQTVYVLVWDDVQVRVFATRKEARRAAKEMRLQDIDIRQCKLEGAR